MDKHSLPERDIGQLHDRSIAKVHQARSLPLPFYINTIEGRLAITLKLYFARYNEEFPSDEFELRQKSSRIPLFHDPFLVLASLKPNRVNGSQMERGSDLDRLNVPKAFASIDRREIPQTISEPNLLPVLSHFGL